MSSTETALIDTDKTNAPANGHRVKLTADELRKAYDLRYKHHLSYSEVGKQLGRHKSTVYDALQRFEKVLPDRAESDVFKEHEAQLLDGLRWKLLCNLADDERLKKETIRSLATSYGILYDKQRLERGESTSNIAYHDIDKSLEDLQGDIASLEADISGTNDG